MLAAWNGLTTGEAQRSHDGVGAWTRSSGRDLGKETAMAAYGESCRRRSHAVGRLRLAPGRASFSLWYQTL
jgi:hypothetical protein